MRVLTNFIAKNWRLIYSTYKAHPGAMVNVVTEFYVAELDQEFTCFFVPPLWVDLFCERESAQKVDNSLPLEAGHLYVFEAYNHRFTFVYIDENTVIYTDYYSEARGNNGFRALLMTAARMREVHGAMVRGDVREIVKFHGAKTPWDLGFEGYPDRAPRSPKVLRAEEPFPEYIEEVVCYPIVREPTLDTLLDVCFNKVSSPGDQGPEDQLGSEAYSLIPASIRSERGSKAYKEAYKAEKRKLTREYYLQWCKNFTLLERNVEAAENRRHFFAEA